MHLIPENVVKNLLALWTTNFKGLETTNEKYRLQPAVIDAIGAACVTAGDTTPAAFGAHVPNIATQLHYFTAESYTLWTTLLGPVVLRNRFQQRKYYTHFIELVRIFNDCLALSISREYVDTELRARIANWVLDFEEYYYQYNPKFLPVCTLTIHALLHIPDDILNAGPMWCYWNYVTERFVGYLVRSSKSRRNPYASLARRLREIAQNSVIKMKYNLHRELDLSDRCDDELKGKGFSNYPDIRVLHPHTKGPLDRLAYKAVRNYLLRTFNVSEAVVDTAIPGSVSSWGRISFLNGGDLIRGVELVHASENYMSRDASYIKYSHDVDKNRNRRRLPVILERHVAYGQLLRIVQFFADLPTSTKDGQPLPQAQNVLLAIVRPVKLAKKNHLDTPYSKDGEFSPIDVIDVDDISCLIARIPDHKPGPRMWALCERPDAMGMSEEPPE
ncbi:hypothetical protein DFH08DRAFT_699504 [Mycena albidolilacea]|uniref:DUF4218 domain-containing protein n=1 Tax=Mycena albidolilacea TaxID=1033008 RepID=A0AAD7EQD4_9AGAR|nr:hypothetical protein DFH08DRAFT_699504 [Mycena albidolilacea]